MSKFLAIFILLAGCALRDRTVHTINLTDGAFNFNCSIILESEREWGNGLDIDIRHYNDKEPDGSITSNVSIKDTAGSRALLDKRKNIVRELAESCFIIP